MNPYAKRIMVAMDYPSAAEANQCIEALAGTGVYVKVGMQLFYAAGLDFVRQLKEKGYSVFLDVKVHDIPNTAKGAMQSLAALGVDMINVHGAGGKKMLEGALEGLELGTPAGQKRPLLIAVTQLTSTSQETMNNEIGIPGLVEETVVRYARLAKEAGLDGVVASPKEVPFIKEACGQSFITVTPGIRPAGSDIGDQQRVTTPEEAFLQLKSDYIVIGRPITKASDPRTALEEILAGIKE